MGLHRPVPSGKSLGVNGAGQPLLGKQRLPGTGRSRRCPFIAYERPVGFRSDERWAMLTGTRMRALEDLQEMLCQVARTPANELVQQRLLHQAQQGLPHLTKQP